MKHTNNPLISIITPSYNSAAYIEQTILSVINQTYKNVEYIIIDGGSTDGTLEIIRRYSSGIAHWRSEPDDGMYQAINKGMQYSTGDIIAYLNSDDLYYPNSLEQVVEIFLSNPSVDLVYGGLDFIDDAGRKLYSIEYPDFNLNYFPLASGAMIGQPASFWRSRLIRQIGLFDESLKMAADFDFFIRAGMNGRPKKTLDVLAAFRLHSSSLTITQAKRGKDEVSILHKKYIHGKSPAIIVIARLLYSILFKVINYKAIMRRVKNAFKDALQ